MLQPSHQQQRYRLRETGLPKAKKDGRPAWVLVLPLVALVYVVIPDLHTFAPHGLRRLAEKCIHKIYATPETALNLPALENDDSVPAYVMLCLEWVRREAYPNQDHEKFLRVEDKAVCKDWTSPHLSLFDMLR